MAVPAHVQHPPPLPVVAGGIVKALFGLALLARVVQARPELHGEIDVQQRLLAGIGVGAHRADLLDPPQRRIGIRVDRPGGLDDLGGQRVGVLAGGRPAAGRMGQAPPRGRQRPGPVVVVLAVLGTAIVAVLRLVEVLGRGQVPGADEGGQQRQAPLPAQVHGTLGVPDVQPEGLAAFEQVADLTGGMAQQRSIQVHDPLTLLPPDAAERHQGGAAVSVLPGVPAHHLCEETPQILQALHGNLFPTSAAAREAAAARPAVQLLPIRHYRQG